MILMYVVLTVSHQDVDLGGRGPLMAVNKSHGYYYCYLLIVVVVEVVVVVVDVVVEQY